VKIVIGASRDIDYKQSVGRENRRGGWIDDHFEHTNQRVAENRS